MKNFIFPIVFFTLLIFNVNGQTINLQEVVQGSVNKNNAKVRADSKGGTVTFDRTYQSGCIGSYNIKWTFSKDLTSLREGDEFTVTLSCISCNTPCGFKWKIANVFSSNNVTKIEGFPSYKSNGNIIMISKTAGSYGVHDWNPGHTSHSYTFKYSQKKDVPLTAFKFVFAGHSVYYVFGKGSAPSVQATNCHTLLGLGKLVASLEIGALEGYGWDWMDRTIDFALNHIAATNCLSSTYLTGLKSRINKAQNTKVFYAEIQDYSQSLETEVATSCSACSACQN